MEWTETQKQDGVTPVARYTLFLGDISLERGAVQYSSSGVRVRMANNSIIVSTRYFENGKEKEGGPREEHELSVQLTLKEQDNINARVALAIVHAAQLCPQQPVDR